MSSAVAILTAANRLRDDPGLLERTANDCRRLAVSIRDHHPLGYGHVDAILNQGLDAARNVEPHAAKLLQCERTLSKLQEAQGVAAVERARLQVIDDAAAAERDAFARRGFNFNNPHRDPAMLDAGRTMGHRLQHLHLGELDGRLSEPDFLAALDGLDRDVRTFLALVGASRRAAKLRISAEAARQAVVALKAA